MSENLAHQQAIVLLEKGYRCHLRGELGEAIMFYERSLAMHPTAEAHTYLGWAYSNMKRYDEAIEQCNLAIVLDPNWGNPYYEMGIYLFEQKKPEEAIDCFKTALSVTRFDRVDSALFHLARAYRAVGRFAEALKMYDRALAINPLLLPALTGKYELLGRMN